ncbi:helicase POLQ-like [Musca vetustissima]|uniref:helicase POLQ-like n=1 Tax=Musca vetustissima TaxID=27455 RepID=UPI002AB7746F|nr:helicase POLQ-like [Musca vetustissima]
MSRNSRNIRARENSNGSSEEQQIKRQRRCDRTIIEPSESVLWPETDDSFFSDVKLDTILKSHQGHANKKSTNAKGNSFFHNDNDDSLFSDIVLPQESEGVHSNVGGTPIDPVLPTSDAGILGDDTLFSEIDVDQLVADDNCKKETTTQTTSKTMEEPDLFNDDDFPLDEMLMQGTQKFLADVAFKIPKPPDGGGNGQQPINKTQRNVDCYVAGTQYETRKEIQNRTVNPLQQTHINREIENLSNISWNADDFNEEEPKEDFPCKGDFYGLPDRVKRMIFETKNIKSLYEWQDECLNLPAIRQRKNLIYALPTSGGKTLVAEILMLREVICREKNVLFILPYVSIVQEKVSAMSPFAIALDFIVEEYTAGKGKCPPVPRKKRKSIFIASIEKGAVLFDSLIEAERANEIGLVVVDELHLIGERGRGAYLEALLTKVMYLNAKIQIVGMSATIGNLSEISQFLNADVYTRGFRPVELKEYIKCGRDILQINLQGQTLEEIFVFSRSVNFNYSEAVLRSDPDHLAGLVTECAPKNGCLIFCSSRKNCENVAVLLSRVLPNKFLEYRKSEKADLMDALDKVCGILSPVLARTIPYGVAYHHSGLTTDERKFIEAAYRFGVLSVICCTSTLAAGVNLPAKRVIIRAPYVGAEFMTLCKYKQMIGRAGRAGMGEAGESILISSSRDNVRVGEMLFSPMDKAISSLDYDGKIGLQSLILSAIGMGMASCRADLHRLVQSTLLAVQASQLGVSVTTMVKEILCEMFKNKVLKLANNDAKKDISDILITQDLANKTNNHQLPERTIKLHNTTRFQLTTIGKAAFKAGIDYKRAYAIHNELATAQKQLILTNYAHILYLVVCFNSNAHGDELFPADPTILFHCYEKLEEPTQRLFKQLGFTEAHAAKMAKTMSIQGPMELKLNRLYKVLILVDLLNLMPIPSVATKYNIERGMLQNLTSQATAAASAIVRLCDQVEEFWCFKSLFERVGKKMDRCGTVELEPLLELPAVKMNRAKQLYSAGYKTIEDIAKCRPMQLVKSVEHMPLRIAKEIISAAKIILMKKLDHLEEETEALKVCLKPNNDNLSEELQV